MPIERSAVEIRLNDANWPDGLPMDRNGYGIPGMAARAMAEAQEVLAEFDQVAATKYADRNLSAAGAREAIAEWAAKRAQGLQEKAERLRKATTENEARLTNEMLGNFTERPTELADVQELAEIRSWLSTLPETVRFERVRRLIAEGDTKVMRALSTVAPYISPVPEEQLALLRTEAVNRTNPEKAALLGRLRKATEVAERAVTGVVQFMQQEGAITDLAADVRQRQAQGMPAIRVDASGRRKPEGPYRPAA